jgi:adenine-specific DNA-methyltransferase
VIKYLGSKRVLVPKIVETIAKVAPHATTVLDLFSGTSRVGHALKRAGYRVIANDHNAYAHALALCYVQADREDVLHSAQVLIEECNGLPGAPGYFTKTFCEEARYIQPFNGERIDAIRTAIAAKGLEPELEAVLLVSLMEAADRVDSTTGVQMAYLKQWSARSKKRLLMRMPDVLVRARAGKGRALMLDAVEAAGIEADVVYIDPPYNQHSYLGNYHVWETLVRWDAPETFGIANKRSDVRERQSPFNSRLHAAAALRRVLERVRAPVIVVSFSDEGFISRIEMEGMLGSLYGGRASVRTIETAYPRYVGAKIGIYNPAGEKVGKIGKLLNTEYLFVVTDPARVRVPSVSIPVAAVVSVLT